MNGDPLSASRLLILDLDGTVYLDDQLLPGAEASLDACRSAGWTLRFATNTTRMSRDALCAKLRRMGLDLNVDEVSTAPVASAAALRSRGLQRVLPLLPEDTWKDLKGLDLVTGGAEAVLVGDCGDGFTFELLNRAFRELVGGAALFACQKNRFWRVGGELVLDAGAFVAALEFATDRPAEVIGKPSPSFFRAVAASAGASDMRVVVVGDDVYSDILGAQSSGFDSVLVRTGKYRVKDLERSGAQPGWTVDSIAELPRLLGQIG